MKVFAIDPSINHLGWAVMQCDVVEASGTIEAPGEFKAGQLTERIEWMMDTVEDTQSDFDFDTIAIERPEPWGAYKSMASDRSGSLQMLTLVVGALIAWALTKVEAENVLLVKVSTWKGQLPKHITKRRMEQKYGRRFATDHEADAVGIGNFCLKGV